MTRIKPIVVKEFRQIVRDRRSLGLLLFIPAFMLIMFGYALNFDVKHISLGIYDGDRSKISREFIQKFLNSEYFDLKYYLDSPDDIDPLMNREEVRIAIIIPQDFSENILRGRNTEIQVIADGANSTAAETAIGYVNAIVQEYSINILTDEILKIGQSELSISLESQPRVWYNPELKSAKFLIPGLIGFIMMVTTVVSTSLSVVREKERGTMEQIIVSPLKPHELILGKTIPYLFISLASTVLVLIVGYYFFGVVIKGSYLLLSLVTIIFLLGCLGLGILISTIAETQQVAFMISVLISLLPTFILSGFVFPIRNMPFVVQVITYAVPARYFLVALRSIILKGVGISAFWEQFVFLLIFSFITIAVSSIRMKKMRVGL